MLEKYHQLIQEAIDNLSWQQEPVNLYEPIAYILSQGGKRIRPHLALISAEMFGAKAEEALMPAIAFEMLHNFTLIHDDIMDKADLRRGKPTVYKKWNTNIAILSGDALFAKAFEQMMKYQGGNKDQLLQLLTTTTIEICEGQQFDIDFETMKNVSIDNYLNMIRLKTAVMLAACLKAGALVAGVNEKYQDLIYQYGLQIGLAFQIQDDWLDVYADVSQFGKNVGGDIAENKKTYMSLRAFEKVEGADRQLLEKYFSSLNFDKQVKYQAVKAIYDKYQVGTDALALVENTFFRQAMQLLSQIDIPQDKKQPLIEWTNKLIGRNY